jgi:anaerobic magnesium-protoporphyrin IX monomethyl ester cyclase
LEILAAYPQEPELAVFEKMPPLGMLWIAGELRKAGHGVMFYDQQVDERPLEAVVPGLRPRLVLVGGTTHSRFASFALARAVKHLAPEATVVYGGPHAAFTAHDTLAHVPEVDIIVHGEGEATSLELADWALRGEGRWEDLPRIRGISYRDGGAIVRTPARPPIADLDALGAPARDLVPMDRYAMQMDYLQKPGTSIISARGCPILCSFCSASAMFGLTYRPRTPARVVDEIEELLAHTGAEGIKIFDSTFTLSRRHTEGFCDEVTRRGLRFPWECEIRVGSVDKELLAKMQAAGCYYVDIGVESGSQRVLDECVRKKIDLGRAEETLRWTRELGLLTKVFFTSGHPGETYAEGLATRDFIWRNRRNIRLQAYQAGIKVYPGTYVAEYAEQHGLLPEGFRWSAPYVNLDNRALFRQPDNVPLLLQPQLGLKELRRLRLWFIAMRMSSPRFAWEKIRAILRGRALGEYARIIGRGALRPFRARAGRAS